MSIKYATPDSDLIRGIRGRFPGVLIVAVPSSSRLVLVCRYCGAQRAAHRDTVKIIATRFVMGHPCEREF